MDWFGVAMLWLGAAILAVKSADVRLMPGAPDLFASDWWSYVPLLLITAAGVIMLVRAVKPDTTFDGPVADTAPQQQAPERLGGGVHALQQHFQKEELRVWDLALRGDHVIRNKVFADCVFYGPVAITFQGCHLGECTFPEPALSLIEVDPDRLVMGVYFFVDCRFDRCLFRQTAIVGPAQVLAPLRALQPGHPQVG